MRGIRLIVVGAALTSVITGFFVTANAERFTGGSYTIDASVIGNSFGGDTTGGSYTLTSSGGESVIGQGSGGSYKLGSGYVAQLESSLQLTLQPGGLVAYYPFDENSGTMAADSSANNNNATTTNGQLWVTGKVGAALSFNDAPNQYVSAPDNANLPTGNKLTVSVWAKQASTSGDATLVSQWDYSGGLPQSGSWALQLTPSGTGVRFFVAETEQDVGNNYADTASNTWSTGSWHHVVAVFDGAQSTSYDRVKLYIDGVAYSTTGGGTFPTTLVNANAPLIIGVFMGLDRYWNGSLDEVKVYSRALSPNEVKAEYDAGVAGNNSGLSFASAITPGISQTSNFDAVVLTDSQNGYNLSASQNQNLTKGADTISAVSGSIGTPVSWVEGTTQGLGFSLFGTNATSIPGKWSSGNAYAAFPGSATSYYLRTGRQPAKDVLNMRLRLDVPTSQVPGLYTNTITTTGTITP